MKMVSLLFRLRFVDELDAKSYPQNPIQLHHHRVALVLCRIGWDVLYSFELLKRGLINKTRGEQFNIDIRERNSSPLYVRWGNTILWPASISSWIPVEYFHCSLCHLWDADCRVGCSKIARRSLHPSAFLRCYNAGTWRCIIPLPTYRPSLMV